MREMANIPPMVLINNSPKSKTILLSLRKEFKTGTSKTDNKNPMSPPNKTEDTANTYLDSTISFLVTGSDKIYLEDFEDSS